MIDASTRLRRAIVLDDVELVRRIVSNRPTLLRNPDFTDKSNTSLHLAASNGCEDIVSYLLDAGHERDEISLNTDHETPLMLAARNGHIDVAVLLFRALPRAIPYTNINGLDALAFAAQNPSATPLIPLLLQHPDFPADVNVRDNEGNTPLHHASAAGSLKALRVLLAAGADHMAANHSDWTPIAYSQTVAAEVYFKTLIAETEKRRIEGVKLGAERERQRAAGLRLVSNAGLPEDEEGNNATALQTPVDEEEKISDALQRHWSPNDRKGQLTPGTSSGKVHDWEGRPLMHLRTRSGGGGPGGVGSVE